MQYGEDEEPKEVRVRSLWCLFSYAGGPARPASGDRASASASRVLPDCVQMEADLLPPRFAVPVAPPICVCPRAAPDPVPFACAPRTRSRTTSTRATLRRWSSTRPPMWEWWRSGARYMEEPGRVAVCGGRLELRGYVLEIKRIVLRSSASCIVHCIEAFARRRCEVMAGRRDVQQWARGGVIAGTGILVFVGVVATAQGVRTAVSVARAICACVRGQRAPCRRVCGGTFRETAACCAGTGVWARTCSADEGTARGLWELRRAATPSPALPTKYGEQSTEAWRAEHGGMGSRAPSSSHLAARPLRRARIDAEGSMRART
ncbi:hypothetical protein BV25DRAFT_89512 [Artomyces pyxidatus]|uniref:Uncharacterized protein n=1 Tax=Artomyces pyxidatus TaxID=48021 RepID=A0ACB8TKV1_9AGAM|nr:hypothetical protein BV25DRAFT_89512 [Artomyces pyxidatus]